MLRINTGSKIMLKVNVDLQDYLINCETTNIWNIKFVQGSVWKISIFIHQAYAISFNIAWTSTVHMSQGFILEQGVIEFFKQKQKWFAPEQIWTMPSRVITYENIYCLEKIKKSAIKVDILFQMLI